MARKAFRKLAISIIPFLFTMTTVYAQDNDAYSSYRYGYGDGYEDGYDDAMDDCPCPPWYYLLDRFYFGLGAGYEGFQVQTHPLFDDERIGTLNTHANGWNYHLFGGYGYYFQRFYLATELFLATSSASGMNTLNAGPNYYGSFRSGTSIGVSVLPGFKVNNSGPLIFGRLGYIDTELHANDYSGTVGSKSSHWTSGFNTGIGLEFPLWKQLSIRAEYDYIKYSSFTHSGIIGSNNGPSDNKASVDLIYHVR